MMLGFLLARAGIDVIVLEKHGDFLRDFRGDTIHPSTLEIMHELGLLDEFLQRPHQEVAQLAARSADGACRSPISRICRRVAGSSRSCRNGISSISSPSMRGCYPAFHLMMDAEATGLIEEAGRVVGVAATTARRTARDPRRSRRRSGRPPLDSCAQRAGLRSRTRRANRRVVDARCRGSRTTRPDARPRRPRADPRDARPRRLLAMRLRHPEGRLRGDPARGLDAFRAADRRGSRRSCATGSAS